MEKTTKMMPVYIVEGKKFTDLAQAKRYEKMLEKKLAYVYYLITHNPDLTEGRGYYKKSILAIPNNCSTNALFQYLIDNMGEPIVSVMGVSPIDNWIIGEPRKFETIEALEKFLRTKETMGIGDFREDKKPRLIYLNEVGKEISL